MLFWEKILGFLLLGPLSSGPCMDVYLVWGFGVPGGVRCLDDFLFGTTG